MPFCLGKVHILKDTWADRAECCVRRESHLHPHRVYSTHAAGDNDWLRVTVDISISCREHRDLKLNKHCTFMKRTDLNSEERTFLELIAT